MNPNVSSLERAFQLAKSGRYPDIWQIKLRLKSEGYAQDQVEGRSLLRQLREIIRLAALRPRTSPRPT